MALNFTPCAIPEHTNTGAGRSKRDNPFVAIVDWLANNRGQAQETMLAYDKADPTTGTIDTKVNKELGRVVRDLNAAGRDRTDKDGNPAPVTVRKDIELVIDGKVTKGVRVKIWAIDAQKRERKSASVEGK